MLRDVDVELKPLTVLIGANNSGKSSFLLAIQRCLSLTGNRGPDDIWRRNSNVPAQFRLKTVSQGDSFFANLQISHNSNPAFDGGATRLKDASGPAFLLHLPTNQPVLAGSAIPDAGGTPGLSSDFSWVPGFLEHLLRVDRVRFDNILGEARKLVGGLDDIRVRANNAEYRTVTFVFEGKNELNQSEVSTGVKILLYFLCLAHHPNPPRTILIEEPENGLHPARLSDVVTVLRSLTKAGQNRQPVQIIVSTHSPYLLDRVDLNEDQVLVFQRGPEGDARVAPVDRDGLKHFLDDFMLGELWYNRGEAGLVKPEKPT